MKIALREAKESGVGLQKLRIGNLDHCAQAAHFELESEAKQLSAIFAAIIRNMSARLEHESPDNRSPGRRRR
jgi:hypothetical protein